MRVSGRFVGELQKPPKLGKGLKTMKIEDGREKNKGDLGKCLII